MEDKNMYRVVTRTKFQSFEDQTSSPATRSQIARTVEKLSEGMHFPEENGWVYIPKSAITSIYYEAIKDGV